MFCAASRVRLSVMFTVPLPLASAFETAGTSFDGRSVAVNLGAVDPDGSVGVSSSQAEAAPRNVRATAARSRRLIVFSFFSASKELSREVEAEVQGVGSAAACGLSERGAQRIGEVQLE